MPTEKRSTVEGICQATAATVFIWLRIKSAENISILRSGLLVGWAKKEPRMREKSRNLARGRSELFIEIKLFCSSHNLRMNLSVYL
jgi:hypothetical protein